jgi:glycosyltransferase involved in cell wall biosynthesis
MKIIICTRDIKYGIGSQVKTEIDEFLKDDKIDKIFLIAPKPYGTSKKIVFKKIKNLGEYFITKQPYFAFKCNGEIKKILKKEKIDTIYLHFSIFAEKFGPKIITKVHGLNKSIPTKNLGGWKSFIAKSFHNIYSIFDYLTLKNSSKILFVSKKTMTEAKKIYPQLKNKFKYSPNYIDSTKFKKVSQLEKKKFRKGLGIDKNKLILLYVGRLEPAKGIITLIKILNNIKKNNFVLLVCGDGPLKNEIKKYKFIKYLGRIPNNKMYKIYNASDIFILPSYHENFPITVLEAKSCGTKIISRDVGDVKFVINKNNIFETDKQLSKILKNKI